MSKTDVKRCLSAATRRLNGEDVEALCLLIIAFAEDGAEDGTAAAILGYAAGVA